jgi:hypothetical protein
VYIAGIIITTATITVIGATITAITAIGESYRIAAVSKLARQGSQHTLRPFAFSDPCPDSRQANSAHP